VALGAATAGVGGVAALAGCGTLAVVGSVMSTHFDEDEPSMSDLKDTIVKGFQRVEKRLAGVQNTLRNQEKTIAKGFLEQKLAKPQTHARTLALAQSYLAGAGANPTASEMCPFEDGDFLDMEVSLSSDVFQTLARDVVKSFECQQFRSLGMMFFRARTTLMLFRATCATIRKHHSKVGAQYMKHLQNDLHGYQETMLALGPPHIHLTTSSTKIDHLPKCTVKVTSDLEESIILSQLPRGAIHLDFRKTRRVYGTFKDLPRDATYINFHNYGRHLSTYRTILGLGVVDETDRFSGKFEDLPRNALYIDFHHAYSKISGYFRDLPRNAIHLDFHSAHEYGVDPKNVKDLPRNAIYLDFACYDVQGSLKDLPRRATYLDFDDLTGELKDLPRSTTHVRIRGGRLIQGKLKDLPRNAKHISFLSDEKITGELKDLPRTVTYIDFGANKKITGELKDLPRTVTYNALWRYPETLR